MVIAHTMHEKNEEIVEIFIFATAFVWTKHFNDCLFYTTAHEMELIAPNAKVLFFEAFTSGDALQDSCAFQSFAVLKLDWSKYFQCEMWIVINSSWILFSKQCLMHIWI